MRFQSQELPHIKCSVDLLKELSKEYMLHMFAACIFSFLQKLRHNWFTVTRIRIGVSERYKYSRNIKLVRTLYQILKYSCIDDFLGDLLNERIFQTIYWYIPITGGCLACRHWYILSDYRYYLFLLVHVHCTVAAMDTCLLIISCYVHNDYKLICC